MAKLGSDFRSTTPTDNDYVRRPSSAQMATELRDLKVRVKAFFGQLFDTDTGDLVDGAVPISVLRALASDPSGTWRRFTVNAKGQFTGGDNDNTVTGPRVFRANLYGTLDVESRIDTVTGTQLAGGETDTYPVGDFDGSAYSPAIFSFVKYTFVVPDNVYRVRAWLVGAGADNGSSNDPSREMEVSFSTTPGSVLLVWVGSGDGSPTRISNADQTKFVDSSGERSSGFSSLDTALGWYRPRFRSTYGVNGTVSATTGKPGVAVLEWYA